MHLTSAPTVKAYIGIGSNLAKPLQQVQQALAAMAQIANTQVIAHSPWYRSKAVGPGEQPDYINGVALLDTTLNANSLLDALHSIENNQGRKRLERWGARTLDLDLLLFGTSIIESSRLTIPHPRIAERNFVLLPLADITPELQIPTHTFKEQSFSAPQIALSQLVANIGDNDLQKL